MHPSQIMILSDLDGTMFNSKGEIGVETKAAISSFTKDGGLFGICTGRAPYNALQFTRDTLINAPSIVFNGAAIYSFENKSYSMLQYVQKDVVRSVIEYCLAKLPLLNIQVYLPEEIIYVSDPAYAQADFLRLHQPCRFLTLSQALSLPWVKALFFGTPEETHMAESMLRSMNVDDKVGIIHSSTDIVENAQYLELVPISAGKGNALNCLKKADELQGRVTIGVGDYYNDADFMLKSDVSVAPRSALEEIKSIASFIGPDNNHELIAYIIQEIVPKL